MEERPKNFDFTGCRVLAGTVGVIVVVLAAVFGFAVIDVFRNGGPSHAKAIARKESILVVNAIKDYVARYGPIPAKGNAQILAALRGGNQGKIVFFEEASGAFNSEGELIDPWGTPYRFDLSDPKKPRVWSCGKNRRDDGGAEGSDDIVSWR